MEEQADQLWDEFLDLEIQFVSIPKEPDPLSSTSEIKANLYANLIAKLHEEDRVREVIRRTRTIIVVLAKYTYPYRTDGAEQQRWSTIAHNVNIIFRHFGKRLLSIASERTSPLVAEDNSISAQEIIDIYDDLLSTDHIDYRRWDGIDSKDPIITKVLEGKDIDPNPRERDMEHKSTSSGDGVEAKYIGHPAEKKPKGDPYSLREGLKKALMEKENMLDFDIPLLWRRSKNI